MSRLAAIKTEKEKRPVRVLCYGVEGVGKSTFAAKAPSPIFICPEGGVDEIQGAVEMPQIGSWKDIRESVKELITGKHEFQTLVLDSIDWIEKLAHAEIIGDSKKDIIRANGGYGAGFRQSEQMHRELIEDLATLREKRKMHVVAIGHYQIKTVKDPESVVEYDGYSIKLHDQVSGLWREWVDAVLFARFKAHVKPGGDDGKTVALGTGERVVYTEQRPAFQAKNRFGLPFEMPFTPNFWNEFTAAAGRVGSIDVIRQEMEEMFKKVKDETTKAAIRESVTKVGNDVAQLLRIRDKMRTITQ